MKASHVVLAFVLLSLLRATYACGVSEGVKMTPPCNAVKERIVIVDQEKT